MLSSLHKFLFLAFLLFLFTDVSFAQGNSSVGISKSIGIVNLKEFDKRLTTCLLNAKQDCLKKSIKDRMLPYMAAKERDNHVKQIRSVDRIFNSIKISFFKIVKTKNISNEIQRNVYLLKTQEGRMATLDMIFISIAKKWYLIRWRLEDKNEDMFKAIGILE